MRRELTVAGLAHTLVTADRPGPVVLIRTPYGRHHHLPEADAWARRGFHCAVGDVRGRHGSPGAFHPYRHEAEDGAAVVDHLVGLGYDRVITAGASYAAHCAVVAAAARPAHVAGVLAAVPALGLGETAREPGGAARLACRVGWWGEHVSPTRNHDLRHTPVVDAVDGWDELWSAPRRTAGLWDALPGLTMPLLAVGGLRDPFAADTEELARCWGGPTRLVLGPWGHELDAPAPGAALAGRRVGALYVAWARALGKLGGDKAFLFADGWRRHTPAGRRVPLRVARGEFRADPDDPFRSAAPGARVADPRCALLTADLPPGELRGRATVTLDVVADVPDADWVVRLSHDGVHEAHAVHRVAHEPGVPRTVTLDLPPVGLAVTGPLRLEVAGHHWPRHARNPHTGEDPVRATALRPSRRGVRAATADLPWHHRGADAVPATALPEEIAS
ncbi:CocE/NonD family hydrolase [Saccharothrix lopnurensis]|uniref:CocE/NonD family hydrolase n=1 Tax=Saccharothrix lopnurensis TaxID=1670621 RepID=A0ABW1P7J0_9PSEU